MNNIKQKAEQLYNDELKKVQKIVGTGLTYSTDLNKTAKKMFGSKFNGVYAADQVNQLQKDGYFIFNLDKSNQPGSHWIAVIKNDSGIMVYDSFGRSSKQIIPNIYVITHNVKDTEHDAEQKILEENCGARALAFLEVYHKHGPEIASMI